MSKSLRQLQHALQARLLNDTHAIDSEIAAYDARRMAVYANGYYSRLCDVLRIDFPGLEHILGAKPFRALSKAYIQHRPSIYVSVRDIGKHLLDFIVTQPQYNHLAACEMIRLEWAMVEALDSADATPVSIDDLKKVASEHWPLMRFEFHSSHQLIPLYTNVAAIWRAVNQNNPSIPKLTETTQSTVWSVWRCNIRVKCYEHAPDEAAVLEAASHGKTFAELSELLCDWHREGAVPKALLQYLMNWINGGIITRIVFDEDRSSSAAPSI